MDHSNGFLNLVNDAKKRVRETTPEAVRRRQETGERFHLIDVREDNEWDRGRALGAIPKVLPARHVARAAVTVPTQQAGEAMQRSTVRDDQGHRAVDGVDLEAEPVVHPVAAALIWLAPKPQGPIDTSGAH